MKLPDLGVAGASSRSRELLARMRSWELDLWPDEVKGFFKNDGGYGPAETLLRKRRTLGPFQEKVIAKLSQDLDGWDIQDVPRSRHQPFVDENGDPANILQSSTGVFSTSDLLLTSLSHSGRAGRQNLTVNTGHLVTHIETNGRNATGVVCQDLIALRRWAE